MIAHQMPPKQDAHVFACADPFALSDLLDFMLRFYADHDTSLPYLFDLRGVDLLQFDADAFQRYIRQFQNEVRPEQSNYCTYLVRDSGSYGMARMFSSWSSVGALRDDRLVFATTDREAALRWIADKVAESGVADFEALVA
ncbi:MAG: hypothetical protein QNJ09_13320 [Paracoccaceae bacterium]|nr:hypothetical protein [Paracoccaceae bacterium]